MSKLFSKIYIEISNLCNLQCTFCPEVQREKKILNVEQFKKIIDSVEPYTEKVTLHLMGEPLLHPNFIEILSVLNKSSLKLELTTNAILLSRHQESILNSNSLRQINFSLQSYMDNFQNKLTNKPIDDYLSTILKFTQWAQTKRPDLFVNFRLWNLEEPNGYLKDDVKYLLKFFSKSFNKILPETVDVKAQKSWKLTDKVRIHWDTRFEWPSLQNSILSTQGFCYGLKSHIGIHADGTVVPCCLDKEAQINLGNIFNSSLSEILATTKAKNIIKNFNQGIACEELCQKCTFKDRFSKISKKLSALVAAQK
jgi:radical SAM protein with 4Fe4S-binding SPASM domain